MSNKQYIAIDLKSFYASVECVERGLNPLTTNLVVADKSRTEKTICLAVSPSLKSYGIPGRARLFEVLEKVKLINIERKMKSPNKEFEGEDYDFDRLRLNPSLKLTFIDAVPRMAYYMQYSTEIFKIYLRYVAPEDIHSYSIDEVFIDVTNYLKNYKMTAKELVMEMIKDVYFETGITATAGIGTNLYLAKIAMDIVAKHIPADENGVRIAELNEKTYRELLWEHKPITDFWRVGKGYAKKLHKNGLYTMGDIARCSLGKSNEYYNEDLLYNLFGINAELLIDHAWGYEPCEIRDIKNYKPQSSSISSGQVLHCAYKSDKARLVAEEMADLMSLDLVDKSIVTNQIVLTVGYDIENLTDPEIRKKYKGEITTDHYGRKIPKHAHGTINLDRFTSSTKLITKAVLSLFDKIINKDLLVRRITITANNVIDEKDVEITKKPEQMDLFTDYSKLDFERESEEKELQKEKKIQKAVLDIKKKYGKNALIKGMNLQEGATAIGRNAQIGGHKA
ncbi:MAG: DNA methylase [Lachnospirales bacterium]